MNSAGSYRTGFSSLSSSSTPLVTSLRRGSSVHGGAGGRNVRVSYATNDFGSGVDLTSMLGGGGRESFSMTGSEKFTMQNLNDRLASYLDKVRTLESTNAKLEKQIREWYDKQTPVVPDYSKYQAIIDDLRRKVTFSPSYSWNTK